MYSSGSVHSARSHDFEPDRRQLVFGDLYSRALTEHCIPVSSADTRRHLRSANRHRGLLALPRFWLNTYQAVGRSQLLARWPGTHSRILSGIQRAAQTVLDVYLKRTCSRVTSASSALAVLNDYARGTHSLTTNDNTQQHKVKKKMNKLK